MNRQEQIEVAVVLFSAILCLTGSFWKAILVSIFVLVSCVLGFGRRWLLGGSFAITIAAIAVVLGAPSPDQWVELWNDAQQAFFVWLPGY
jgi:O-antigen ligase